MTQRPLRDCCLAELVGTFLLIFFGCGAVHVAVLLGGLTGLWQVGIVWGMAIMFAIYTIGGISGAHINPAITLALAFWGKFSRERVFGYLAAQMLGAMLAATTLYILFQSALAAYEQRHGIERGSPESVLTAACYGEYYMNPGGYEFGQSGKASPPALEKHLNQVSLATAFLAELLGTAILGFVVFRTTQPDNDEVPHKLAPVFIGLTVTALICVIAPLTQACFNPARDFGPRIVAAIAGWGQVAIPGPNGPGFALVYGVAPVIGAILGIGFGIQMSATPPHIPVTDPELD